MPTPDRIELYYAREAAPLLCSSPDELVQVLEEMHRRVDREFPVCVVVAISGYSVCVGLGSDPTFVQIHVEPYAGECYTSAGDASAVGTKSFGGCGDLGPIPARNMVAWTDVLEAVREFTTHQRRDERICWEP